MCVNDGEKVKRNKNVLLPFSEEVTVGCVESTRGAKANVSSNLRVLVDVQHNGVSCEKSLVNLTLFYFIR